jgi:hypothetical protein
VAGMVGVVTAVLAGSAAGLLAAVRLGGLQDLVGDVERILVCCYSSSWTVRHWALVAYGDL